MSVVVGCSLMSNEEPLKFGPDLAATDHAALAGLQAAWAVKLRVNGDEEEMLRLRPWICEADGRVTPAGGDTRGEMLQPDGAVRLNELIWPLDGASENVKSWVAPASAGGDEAVILAVAVDGTASAAGAIRPVSNRRAVRTNGAPQRGVASFTICLLTGRRTNAFAVPRPGDRRMAEEVSRR
ncbi:MAG TPA: hypothetical protein VFA08_10800 [Actinomycetota bacterium]|nr:hypothetical protein [Actinomycetota bacterium]